MDTNSEETASCLLPRLVASFKNNNWRSPSVMLANSLYDQ